MSHSRGHAGLTLAGLSVATGGLLFGALVSMTTGSHAPVRDAVPSASSVVASGTDEGTTRGRTPARPTTVPVTLAGTGRVVAWPAAGLMIACRESAGVMRVSRTTTGTVGRASARDLARAGWGPGNLSPATCTRTGSAAGSAKGQTDTSTLDAGDGP